jgi:hypothetical protein
MKTLLALILISSPAFADATSTASYVVPVPGPLAPFSQFQVPYTVSEGANESTVLTYTLPATLLGHEQTFSLQGQVDAKSESFSLSGSDAVMDCAANGTTGMVDCKVDHRGVKLDLDGVRRALDASGAPQFQRVGGLEVAKFVAREGGDLVGTFTYPRGVFYR